MSASKLFVTASLVSIIVASTITSAAFAWHPEGAITKKVQNMTTNSIVSDANSIETAIAAKPGDILKYTIEVRNEAKPATRQYNDMDKTIMTDTLPTGVELVSNPSVRTLTEKIGLVVPGQKVVKEYTVKVTTKISGVITNEACFTGDTVVDDNPQQGCDNAVVVVTVPPVVEKPVETPAETPVATPVEKTAIVAPIELPKTGAANTSALSALSVGAVVYVSTLFARARRVLS